MEHDSDNKTQHFQALKYAIIWLKLLAIVHIVGGLCLSFNWPSEMWALYRNQLMIDFNLTNAATELVTPIIKMLIQLFGPTIASWGVLMLVLCNKISADSTEQGVNYLIWATLLWFSLDTYISVSFGIWLHAVINLLAALSILLPLIFIKMRRAR